MNTDVFFTMGTTHKICQDYAIARNHETSPLVLLSDGCSSAPDTDFGSRLLVKAAEPNVYEKSFECRTDPFLRSTLTNAHTFCRTLQLPDESLCATLLVARIEGNFFKTLCVGDGVVAARHNSGAIFVYEYQFESGAPYYLRYEIDPKIKEDYFKQFGKKGKQLFYTVDPKGVVDSTKETPLPFDETTVCFEECFELDEFDLVAIFSDGVSSFVKQSVTSTTKQNVAVPTIDIVKEILSFKGFTGDFVQRRCQRAFKTFRENHYQNCDDFSVAVIAKDKK